MGKRFDAVDERAQAFIEAQHMFFVATAPIQAGGHVNLSPKGLDSFRVLGPRDVAYLDFVGSGAETVAHLRENGRITLMFCAFEGPPNILRIYGRGWVVEPGDADFADLRGRFPGDVPARSVVRVAVESVATSCGWGVPLYSHQGERSQMADWIERKGEDGLRAYQVEKNARSLDGLPALRWAAPE